MLNNLKNFHLQILTYCLILLVLLILLHTNSYENVSTDDYNEVYSYYFKPKNNEYESNTTSINNLFDISNFKFLITPGPDFCAETGEKKDDIRVVIIVTSYFSNVETRSAMRRAFPRVILEELHVRRVFLLGVAPDNKYVNQGAVEDESRRYGDIVQGNFFEAYRNLTYKHVMGLKWVSDRCNVAQFVIKMDDDIVVNMLKILELLKMFRPDEDFIGGYILKGLQAKREKANKWYVTKEEYPLDSYPPFFSGWMYITTSSVCNQLVDLAKTEKYFWIDDVYVTGILASKIQLKTYDLKQYFTDHPEYFQCCLNDLSERNLDCDILVGPNGGRTNLFYEFNEAFSGCGKKKLCRPRLSAMNGTCAGTKSRDLGRGSAVISRYNLVK